MQFEAGTLALLVSGLVRGEVYRVSEKQSEIRCGHVAPASNLNYACHPLIVDVGEDREQWITLSMGVAAYPDQALSVDALLKASDRALYRAKQEGRDRTIAAG
jgi:diguanylate cyclase (GGDEF)-like protein